MVDWPDLVLPPINLHNLPRIIRDKNVKVSEIDNFDELLEDAESKASTDWEMGFVSDFRIRYDEYEENCYISDKQLEILERIAHG